MYKQNESTTYYWKNMGLFFTIYLSYSYKKMKNIKIQNLILN